MPQSIASSLRYIMLVCTWCFFIISSSFTGYVEIVNPDQVDDLQTFKIAREIKEQIEAKLQYPGTIKVTVIRETRATDVAK